MSFLIDTHVLVWLATDPDRVPLGVRRRLIEADAIAVSAASAFEIAQKSRSGRLPRGEHILARWRELLRNLMADDLPLTGEHMIRAGSLEWSHRDPFDRMLVAQSQLTGLELVTKDAAIRGFGEVQTAHWD